MLQDIYTPLWEDFDPASAVIAPSEKARGKRHSLKTKRWQVIYDPEGYLADTWLDPTAARQMLEAGDFYPTGTCLKIVLGSVETVVYVKGDKLYLDREFKRAYRL